MSSRMTSRLTYLLLIEILIFNLSFLTIPFGSLATTLTAYEVLEEYDLPIGLLPKGVVSYTFNSTTGAFEVYLNETCSFKIDSYELKYKKTITGVISKDELKSLKGISVKVWWFWFSIKEVIKDDDELEFSIGSVTADFAVSKFDESPTCGCGFDCLDCKTGDEEKEMMAKMGRINGRFVSS